MSIINHLIDYIKGYLKIDFTGHDKVRFLNLCRNNHLNIWDIQTGENDEKVTFFSSIESFFQMKKIRRKCNGEIRITEKKGLSFKTRKYRKRIFFLFGIIIFFVLIKIISLYIWNISFDGNYSYTDVELMNFLNENHVHNGLKKSEISCDDLEYLIRKQYSDITWVSVEIKGTRMIVHIKENFDSNIAKTEDKPYNIISNVDGVIDSIITRSGVPQVKSGDIIKKDQLLVNGTIEILNDSKDVIGYDYVNSDADIYAYVTYDFHDSFNLQYQQKIYTGKQKKAVELKIFEKSLFLSGFKKRMTVFDTVKDYKNLTLTKNYYLPVSVCHITYNEYEIEDRIYDKDEAVSLANEKINEYIGKLEEKGIQIIENNVTIDVNTSECVISGNFVVLQKIGQIEYIDETKTNSETDEEQTDNTESNFDTE